MLSAAPLALPARREAIAQHNTPRCSLPFPTGLDEFPEVQPGSASGSWSSSCDGSGPSFAGSVEGLPSSSGSSCDFCGPPNGSGSGANGNGAVAVAAR